MTNRKIENYELATKIAQAKFALIAPAVTGTFTDPTLTDYCKRISMVAVEWPDGKMHFFSYKTLIWWLHRYRKFGLDGLMPKYRLDNGVPRVLDEKQKHRIIELLTEFPRITGVMIHEKMINEGTLDKNGASVDTVQRFIRNNHLREKVNEGEGERKEVRGWEYPVSCDGYEADTCYAFYIYDEEGNYRRTYLIALIDVHSRMIVGAEFFYNDNAANFQKVWKSAVLRYGKSKVLILDNGASYKNKSTKEIEAKLGTRIIYNPPYSPTGKAVIERFFKTCRDRWFNCDHGSSYHSLKELNDRLKIFIGEYNRTPHSSLSQDSTDTHTPFDRYCYDMKDRTPWQLSNKPEYEYQAWIDDVFLHETSRKVNGDSTVVIENQSFDVPSQFIGERVIVRYDPLKFKTVYLYDIVTKKKYPLQKTDRVENGKVRRSAIVY